MDQGGGRKEPPCRETSMCKGAVAGGSLAYWEQGSVGTRWLGQRVKERTVRGVQKEKGASPHRPCKSCQPHLHESQAREATKVF